jgi:hypothetical protein
MRWLAFAFAACVGAPPLDPSDAPIDAPEVTAAIAGRTFEWFAAPDIAVGQVELAFDGTTAQPHATSDHTGAFVATVPPGSVVHPIATRAGFRPTRNPAVLALEGTADRDVHVVAAVQVTSLYLAVTGAPPTAGASLVFADLRRHGEPIVGPLTEVALVTDAGIPVPAIGPIVVDATGRAELAATTTSPLFGGRSVVAWLDCPAGTWRIALAGELLPHPVICDREGATIIDTTLADAPTLPANPTFALDIYPRLGRPSQDPRGLACTACHNGFAVAAGSVPIAYDGVPTVVHALLASRSAEQPAGAKILDLEAPEQSLLLRRPLYEVPPDHPNATLIDPRSFDYQLLLRWIRQGARP